MTATMDARPEAAVPPIRQDVVDRLMALLAYDDIAGFAEAERHLAATRAEVAAASAGLVESRQLDLSALQHALELLEGVAQLPDPEPAPLR